MSEQIILNYIVDNVCNGNQQRSEWVLDWIADIFQKPARNPRTGIVLHSREKGAGKSFMHNVLCALFEDKCYELHAGMLTGFMPQALAGFLDEFDLGSNLKNLGIAMDRSYNRMKYKDIPNYTRYIIACKNDQLPQNPSHYTVSDYTGRLAFFEISKQKTFDFQKLTQALSTHKDSLKTYFNHRMITNNVTQIPM